MKLSLLTSVAAVAFVGFVGAAQAADVVAPAEPLPAGWTGLYIGAHVGYGETDMSGCIECDEASVADPDELDLNGIVGGLHAGYNYQTGNIVVGLEGDVDFTDWSDKDTSSSDSTDKQKANVDTLGTVRARLGVASDETLFYLTGGVAWSDAKWKSMRGDSTDTAHFDDAGGVIGGGLEHMVFQNVSVRAEGLYYFFDDRQSVADFNEGSPGEHVTLDDMWQVRVGVSYHFNVF
jgi:outer membrane immunogenic protein